MTTSHTPGRVLKAQATSIAKTIKAVERGKNPIEDVGGKIAASRRAGVFTVAVVMDDKIIRLRMAWVSIRASTEDALAEMILKYMRAQRENA